MAIPIKQVPVLTGVPAQRFIQKAMESYENRGGIDFSEQTAMAERILSKSRLNFIRTMKEEREASIKSANKFLMSVP